jgi:hypothetical protein
LSKAKRYNARSFPSFPNLQSYWILVFVRIDIKGSIVYKKAVQFGFIKDTTSKNGKESAKEKEQWKKLLNILPVRV